MDIIPPIRFYIGAPFCHPVKCIINNEIAGIGTTIIHAHTAWLAHIIVDSQHRNKGIGSFITHYLVSSLKHTNCHTILLIATRLGAPVYKKAGFEKETEYVFFKDGKSDGNSSALLKAFDLRYLEDVYALDQQVSGENRRKLLKPHLVNALLAVDDNNDLQGFYMPTLGEGLIIARTQHAGDCLMAIKHADGRKAAIPMENEQAINFLTKNGYCEFLRGTRMRLGKKLDWQPDKIYGRIGGNLG